MCILRESKGKGLAVPKEWRVEGGKRRQCSPGGYFRHVLPTQNLTRRLLLGIGDSGKWELGRKNERRRGGGEQGIDRNTKERDEKQTEKETWLLAMVSNWTEQPYLTYLPPTGPCLVRAMGSIQKKHSTFQLCKEKSELKSVSHTLCFQPEKSHVPALVSSAVSYIWISD